MLDVINALFFNILGYGGCRVGLYLNMEIDNNILNRFKIYESDQLFDIDQKDLFIALKDNRCPKCGCRLVFMRNGKMAYCKSVRHKKRFIISILKLNHLNGK